MLQGVSSKSFVVGCALRGSAKGFDFVFVYWHLIVVTPDGPRFRSTFLPRLTLAMVVCFVFDK